MRSARFLVFASVASVASLVAVGALAAGAVALWARPARAGGCRGFLEWRPGPDGKTPPNAGLLFAGYTFDDPIVKVTAAGKAVASTVEKWGFESYRCGNRYFVVRPASGSWKKGAALDVDLGGYGKAAVVIGATPDTRAPTAKVFGPARKKDPTSLMRVINWAGVRDDSSPIVLVRATFADPATDKHGEKAFIRGPEAGALEFSSGCAAVVIEDTAGNRTSFPEACR